MVAYDRFQSLQAKISNLRFGLLRCHSVVVGLLHMNTQLGINQFCSIPNWLSN